MELFKKVSLKDILEDESIFKPKRRDLLKEENIVFHTNNSILGVTEEGKGGMVTGEIPNELDFEKQRELELYRKRFEEALVRIEDKEDVIALQQAKREIDDEFVDEDGVPATGAQSTIGASSVHDTSKEPNSSMMIENADEEEAPAVEEDGKHQAAELDSKSAGQLSKEMKKSEFINWRTHQTLNEVTKMAIEYYEQNYQFDTYLDDRAKKDNKFVNPLKDEDEDGGDGEDKPNRGENDSEFSMSDEDEEMSQGNPELDQQWDRAMADQMYKKVREEIEQKYFVV